jgi:putative CocE/NonD family hydrolase
LKLYLDRLGVLSSNSSVLEDRDSYDEYISDPNKPVPYTGEITTGMRPEYMVEDQRFAARRPDVLVYETDPLDHDISIAGPVVPSLSVSTSGTDSDFVVKLIDVYQDALKDDSREAEKFRMGGYQQLVRGEPFRGKYRYSFSKPAPFVPGQVAKIEFAMPDICHTFRKGHRIMVQIQSSWFPLVDRNPQQFLDIYSAKENDFKKATQRIYHSKSAPSFILLNALK